VTEIDSRRQQEYENQLAEALRQIRDESKEMIRKTREEVEASYEKRVLIIFSVYICVQLCNIILSK